MSPNHDIVSVYDDRAGVYDYYRVSQQPGKPWTMAGNPVGTAVRDALPALPRGARKVGRGRSALGTVVRSESDWKEPLTKWGLIGLGVYVVGRLSGIIPPLRRW